MFNTVNDSFISLHNHSEMSNLTLKDCTIKIKDAILYVANKLGQVSFALTDHDSLSNHMKYLNTVNELKQEGKIPNSFKPILGNEIYLVDEQELKDGLERKEYINFYHFILIALDDVGHRQLRELSSIAWNRMFNYKGIERRPTFYSDIEQIIGIDKGHVIASTACLGGYLAKHISKSEEEMINNFILWGMSIFGENNFFLEMQPHGKAFDELGYETKHEQQIVNEWIINSGYKAIITTDSHYLKKEDLDLHASYLKSDEDDETYASGGREVKSFYETTYFMSTKELRSYLHYFTDEEFNKCLYNSWQIMERVREYNLFKQQDIMRIPLPPRNEWYWQDELVDLIEELGLTNLLYLIDDTDDCNNYLASLWMQGFETRNIPREEWKETLIRLDEEMENLLGISITKNVTMSAYFILMHKFIDIIWEQANSIVGVSRGSAGGWVLNYLLGVVQINPLKQPSEMPLWRFISSERPDYP